MFYRIWRISADEYELLEFEHSHAEPRTITIGTRAHCLRECPSDDRLIEVDA